MNLYITIAFAMYYIANAALFVVSPKLHTTTIKWLVGEDILDLVRNEGWSRKLFAKAMLRNSPWVVALSLCIGFSVTTTVACLLIGSALMEVLERTASIKHNPLQKQKGGK